MPGDRDTSWCRTLAAIADKILEKAVNEFFTEASIEGLDDCRAGIAITHELIDWAAALGGSPSKEAFLKYASDAYDKAEIERSMEEKDETTVVH